MISIKAFSLTFEIFKPIFLAFSMTSESILIVTFFFIAVNTHNLCINQSIKAVYWINDVRCVWFWRLNFNPHTQTSFSIYLFNYSSEFFLLYFLIFVFSFSTPHTVSSISLYIVYPVYRVYHTKGYIFNEFAVCTKYFIPLNVLIVSSIH